MENYSESDIYCFGSNPQGFAMSDYIGCFSEETDNDLQERPQEFTLDQDLESPDVKEIFLGKRYVVDSSELASNCESESAFNASQHSRNVPDLQDDRSEICSTRSFHTKSQGSNRDQERLGDLIEPTPNTKSPKDKTDLKLFSEITVKHLKKAGYQGLSKELLEAHFKAELTDRAIKNMSDGYCLRRRLNLILTVLKSPIIGLVEEIKDPTNKKNKVIKLTAKYLNGDTSNLVNLVEERAFNVETKHKKLLQLNQKLAKLREIIQTNKMRESNSVSRITFDSSKEMVATVISASDSSRVSLGVRVFAANLTKITECKMSNSIMLSTTVQTTGSSLLNVICGLKD
jgi:hypothetical protein